MAEKIVSCCSNLGNKIKTSFITAWANRQFPDNNIEFFNSLENIPSDADRVLIYSHDILGENPLKMLHDLKRKGMAVNVLNMRKGELTNEYNKFLNKFINIRESVIKDLPNKNWKSRSPFGFRIVGGKGEKHLEIDEDEWECILQIFFRRNILEQSFNSIATTMNSLGMRNRGNFFSPTSVRRILKSKIIKW